jgi:hypothetical protein
VEQTRRERRETREVLFILGVGSFVHSFMEVGDAPSILNANLTCPFVDDPNIVMGRAVSWRQEAATWKESSQLRPSGFLTSISDPPEYARQVATILR